MRSFVVIIAVAVVGSAEAGADVSKLDKEGVVAAPRGQPPAKRKVRTGYPLAEDLGYALRFYWLAMQDRFELEPSDTDIYTPRGHFLGVFPSRFVRALKMEGSGVLSDGRVVNYAGRCHYGVGTCFRQLDHEVYPFGRGARRRTLTPFRSVAVDRELIELGEPLYVPEFDGLPLPNGQVHDGCVRADDTGGNIRERKIDFFVVSFENFRILLRRLNGVIWITPHVEAERCRYLLDP